VKLGNFGLWSAWKEYKKTVRGIALVVFGNNVKAFLTTHTFFLRKGV